MSKRSRDDNGSGGGFTHSAPPAYASLPALTVAPAPAPSTNIFDLLTAGGTKEQVLAFKPVAAGSRNSSARAPTAGSTGQVLAQQADGTLAFEPPFTSGGLAANTVLYANNATPPALSGTALGANNTVLTSTGAAAAPTFSLVSLTASVAGTLPIGNGGTGNTAGAVEFVSIPAQAGLLSFTGLTGTNRIKTVRDAADTILELGGSYTPTGTWTNMQLTTPTLGTPVSGTLTTCVGYPIGSLSPAITAGVATILNGAASVVVLLNPITANAVILLMWKGNAGITVGVHQLYSSNIIVNTSFQINSTANVTADQTVNYLVVNNP